MNSHRNWPVLKSYAGDHLRRISLPVGGIGTGTVGFGGRGDLRDWEVVNRPAKGFAPPNSFFALRTQTSTGEVFCRALEGPIAPEDYEGSFGCRTPNHGLPRFSEAAFETAYPLGQVVLSDPACPLRVRLQAFNPLVPGAVEASEFPVAILRVVLSNPTPAKVKASLCGNLTNFIGQDGSHDIARDGVNEFESFEGGHGVWMRSNGVSPDHETWGTLALAVLENQNVTHRTSWAQLSWGDSLLDFWDDFSSDGALEERVTGTQPMPTASLCMQIELAPNETHEMTFVLAWCFPNRQSWSPDGELIHISDGAFQVGPPTIGNFYAARFGDARGAVFQLLPRLAELEAQTLSFVSAFCGSDLPLALQEAALFNVSTLRSQTCFRTPDGHFFGWEGVHAHHGSCPGNCTHVWNYEQTTPFLFPELARSMREIEFLHATNERGLMSFRVGLPLEPYARISQHAAADGQMGCLMKLYRDWRLCGDDEWLRRLWPGAKRALEFCWQEGSWDADCDGVMEGRQHNTMDVDYFGPNPQMQGWYLGALRASEEMARGLGEDGFADKCRQLFERGKQWTDDNLWNGDYYEHHIRPIGEEEPEHQLGSGCLVDQLVGQTMAHVCGLGYLLDPAHVATTLDSTLRFNARDRGGSHFNHLRSYALGDEAALLMASYPKGRRPLRPFPYFNEVMTGFEHIVATHLIYEGQTQRALETIENIRSRYDGRKRNPFDEAECGFHYARAMAAWGHLLAWTGFAFSAHDGCLQFNAAKEKARWFWSCSGAWGTFEQTPTPEGIEVELRVLGGELRLQKLELRGGGEARWRGGLTVSPAWALREVVATG